MSSVKGLLLAGALCAAANSFSGCTATGTLTPQVFAKATPGDSPKKTPDSERRRYQADRDPKALKWLLVHCVHRQMTVKDINGVLGEDATRVHDDTWVKKGNGFREDDTVYRWGPDKNGREFISCFARANSSTSTRRITSSGTSSRRTLSHGSCEARQLLFFKWASKNLYMASPAV